MKWVSPLDTNAFFSIKSSANTLSLKRQLIYFVDQSEVLHIIITLPLGGLTLFHYGIG